MHYSVPLHLLRPFACRRRQTFPWPTLLVHRMRYPRPTSSCLPGFRHAVSVAGLAVVTILMYAPACQADETSGVGNSNWVCEVLTLRDGRKYEGLVTEEPSGKVRFLQIVRPKGRPLYGVQHEFKTEQIASIKRLSDKQRDELSQQFAEYRQRALIEAGRMEDVSLKAVKVGGGQYWQYEGPWFVLQSTAEEDVTRRCIVRVEQVFAAYRQILPPRIDRPSETKIAGVKNPDGNGPAVKTVEATKNDTAQGEPLKILFFGSTEQYRTFLRSAQLPIENPAFFAADWNAVVAGSDVDRLAAQVAAARQEHDRLRKHLDRLRESLPEQIRALSVKLRAQGVSTNETRRQISLLRRRFEVEIRDAERDLDRYDRKNDNVFDEATAQMFDTLYHEAFHAYLENYVFAADDYNVPRWLNEGLAQVFETGILEAGMFRVDAPHPDILERLKADLRGKDGPLSLAQVLTADHRSFLVAHGTSAEASSRHYAYSWGLSYYLAFQQRVLGTKALEKFVDPQGITDPIARFEQLVGQPLAEFEPKWRQYMLSLTSK